MIAKEKNTPWDLLGIKKQFAIHMEIERKLSRSVDRSVIREVFNIIAESPPEAQTT